MKLPVVQVTHVSPDSGERWVKLKLSSGVELSCFDGYKDGIDGIGRPATGEWLLDKQVSVLLQVFDGDLKPDQDRKSDIENDKTSIITGSLEFSTLSKEVDQSNLSLADFNETKKTITADINLGEIYLLSCSFGDILVNPELIESNKLVGEKISIEAHRLDIIAYQI